MLSYLILSFLFLLQDPNMNKISVVDIEEEDLTQGTLWNSFFYKVCFIWESCFIR